MPHIDPDELDDPDDFGIYGKNHLTEYDGPRDAEGIPIITVEHLGGFFSKIKLYQWQCRHVLKEFGIEPWPSPLPPDDTPEVVKDAWLILQKMTYLRSHLKRIHIFGTAMFALQLGETITRFDTRWAEEFTHDGRRRKDERRSGGKASKKLTPQEETRCCEMMSEEMARNRLKPTPASRRVAPKLKLELGLEVSSRTVYETWKKLRENA